MINEAASQVGIVPGMAIAQIGGTNTRAFNPVDIRQLLINTARPIVLLFEHPAATETIIDLTTPAASPDRVLRSVSEWLASLGLSEHEAAFQAHGYDCLEYLQLDHTEQTGLTIQRLAEIGVSSLEDQLQVVDSLHSHVGDCTASLRCMICLEVIRGGEESIVNLPCDHLFHSQCIQQWFNTLNANSQCPVCRKRTSRRLAEHLDSSE